MTRDNLEFINIEISLMKNYKKTIGTGMEI